jgi:hypothetical protein
MMPLQNIFASRMGVQAPVQTGDQQTMQAQSQSQPQPGAMQFGARPMTPTGMQPVNGMPQSGAMLGARQMLPVQQQPIQPQGNQQIGQIQQPMPMQNNLRARLGMLA